MLTVENVKQTAGTKAVADHLALGRDREIEVKAVRLSSDPTEKTERGIF